MACSRVPTGRAKREFDETELTELQARVKGEEYLRRKMRDSPMYKADITAKAAQRQSLQNEWQRLTGELVKLSPNQLPRVTDFLVSLFGIKNVAGFIPDAYSLAGKVRGSIVRSQKVAQNLILYQGRMLSAMKINRVNELVSNVIKDKQLAARLLDEVLTVGQIPVNRSLYSEFKRSLGNAKSMTDIAAEKRFAEFEDLMRSNGFTQSQIDELVREGRDVALAFDHMAIAARSQGVNVGEFDDLGYLPREFTAEAKLRIADQQPQDLLENSLVNEVNLATKHAISRSTWQYVPEDTDFAAQLLGISPTQLNDLLLDGNEWIRFLQDNVSTQQLDLLVDSGVFGKLPMSNAQVFDYMKAQYNLPYEHLNELVITDVNVLMSKYAESLMHSVGGSNLLTVLVSPAAHDAGWTVSRETVESNADYANFVPIGRSFEDVAKQQNVTIDQLARLLGVDTNLLAKLPNTYVHPIVARQWRAIMAVSMNPVNMHSFGSMVLSAARFNNKLVLANVQYPLRNAYSNVINNAAAGGHTAMLPHAMEQTRQALNNGIASGAFDNTVKAFDFDGALRTEQEMYELYLKLEGASAVPGTVSMRVAARPADVNVGGLVVPGGAAVWRAISNPANMRRSFSYMLDYVFAHGNPVNGRKISASERIGRFTNYAMSQIKELADEAYTPYAVYAMISESAAKWNVFRTLATKSDARHELIDSVAQVVQSGQRRRFNNSIDMQRHLAEYFPDPFDVGRATAFINHYVRPFATFAMANPMFQFRHAMRHPHLYLASQRLHAMVNKPLLEDDQNNEYTIPGWIQEGLPWFIGRSPDGDPYVLLPQNFDGGTDAFSFFNELGEDVQRLVLGRTDVGTPEERLSAIRGDAVKDAISEQAAMLHTPWRVMIEQITGRAFFSGREIETSSLDAQRTLAGVPLSGRWAHFFENVAPQLRMLDSLNLFSAFGRAPERNATGGITNPGQLSWFGTERQRSDEFIDGSDSSSWALRAARIAGFNIRELNYDKQYYRTMRDMNRTVRELDSALTRTREDLRARQGGLEGAYSLDEQRRRIAEFQRQLDLSTKLHIDISRVNAWGEARGLPPDEALEKLRELQINIQTLPVPEIEDAIGRSAAQRFRDDQQFILELLKSQ